jgi:5-methylcytosine-specific restriction protein A
MEVTENAVKKIYVLANDVYFNKLSKKQAVEKAVENGLMNKGSAQDYIQNFLYIMEGFVYKRTMNLVGTRCYLELIYNDFGLPKLSQALDVVTAHIQYYNSLGHGKQVKTQELVNEFVIKYNIDFQGIVYPDEVSNDPLFEGGKKQVMVNLYERNAKARSLCIEHYGNKCFVCGFDFHDNYGNLGTGYIHVHHEYDLAKIGKCYVVDPVDDLKPVCPNCHAMLHKTKPAMSVTKLKKLIVAKKRT